MEKEIVTKFISKELECLGDVSELEMQGWSDDVIYTLIKDVTELSEAFPAIVILRPIHFTLALEHVYKSGRGEFALDANSFDVTVFFEGKPREVTFYCGLVFQNGTSAILQSPQIKNEVIKEITFMRECVEKNKKFREMITGGSDTFFSMLRDKYGVSGEKKDKKETVH